MEYILVLFVHAAILSSSDSMALTTVGAFSSYAECKKAGEAANRLTANTRKDTRYACLERGVK